ncbi:hypothetical protein I312_106142 [Cryptococcus bacillisporus CA1280]|uniref:uncharacterized protein n=1 Tax=Cryptococcus bacillisporus CA1280 TaxID=1296109 RepID=UPI00336802B8
MECYNPMQHEDSCCSENWFGGRARSADVCLKERRKLMFVMRETPMNVIHLENMLFLRRAGAIIFPSVSAYCIRPQTIDDLTNQTVGRILDSMGLHTAGFARWAENL